VEQEKKWESIDLCGRFPPFSALFSGQLLQLEAGKKKWWEGEKGKQTWRTNKDSLCSGLSQ